MQHGPGAWGFSSPWSQELRVTPDHPTWREGALSVQIVSCSWTCLLAGISVSFSKTSLTWADFHVSPQQESCLGV